MIRPIEVDVVVVGAGITGLMLSKKLSGLGYSVFLVEKRARLAGESSTRNEGWLHRGTYHATSIKNRQSAISVARRCIWGHNQVKAYAPEAVEEPEAPSYAVTNDSSRVDEIVSRWDEAGVTYRQLSLDDLRRRAPTVKVETLAAAFEVNDVSINTRLLYRKLLTDAERTGTRIFPETEIVFTGDGNATLTRGSSSPLNIYARAFAFTTGYGTAKLFKDNLDFKVPLRYWKSHLLITPRLSGPGVFNLDPKKAAMMNHDNHSIVGLNEDAFSCSEPNLEPVQQNVAVIERAVEELFVVPNNYPRKEVACIKVDFAEQQDLSRSLNISVSEPVPNHFCVFPGKMTEAPYVTDTFTRMLFATLGDDRIAPRPCDELKSLPQVVLG